MYRAKLKSACFGLNSRILVALGESTLELFLCVIRLDFHDSLRYFKKVKIGTTNSPMIISRLSTQIH
jgi:hypothetical protein